MWNISGDYTVDVAQKFFSEDFIKVIRRTRFLYVETKPPSELGYGFYEPVTLSLCWCDFLGALYCGNGKGAHTQRMTAYLNEVMGTVNANYKAVAADLVSIYRHGPVH